MESAFGATGVPNTLASNPEVEALVMRALANIRYNIFCVKRIKAKSLARAFAVFDKNKNQSLERGELVALLEYHGLFLSRDEIDSLLVWFDVDGDGRVSLVEFVRGIHGQMNSRRRTMVEISFQQIGPSVAEDTVQMHDMKARYDPSSVDREMVAGRGGREEAVERFAADFNAHRGSLDPAVRWEEFLDYYNEVSASIRGDDEFVAQMECCWGVLEKDPQQGCLDQLCQMIRWKLEQKCGGPTDHEAHKLALRRMFKHYDRDGCGELSPSEFLQALQLLGLPAEQNVADVFFQKYDTDQSGKLKYKEFIDALYS